MRDNGKLTRRQTHKAAAPYRVNMLTGASFMAAFLGEFGFTQNTIAKATGLTYEQVRYRLVKAQVKTSSYRTGNNVVGQMILRGARKAGVDQLRAFTEQHLRHELRKLGWSAVGITPEHPLAGMPKQPEAAASAPLGLAQPVPLAPAPPSGTPP